MSRAILKRWHASLRSPCALFLTFPSRSISPCGFITLTAFAARAGAGHRHACRQRGGERRLARGQALLLAHRASAIRAAQARRSPAAPRRDAARDWLRCSVSMEGMCAHRERRPAADSASRAPPHVADCRAVESGFGPQRARLSIQGSASCHGPEPGRGPQRAKQLLDRDKQQPDLHQPQRRLRRREPNQRRVQGLAREAETQVRESGGCPAGPQLATAPQVCEVALPFGWRAVAWRRCGLARTRCMRGSS